LTIADEDDEEPFVNVQLAIQEAYVIHVSYMNLANLCHSSEPLPDKPIKGTWEGPIAIPTKPKKTSEPEPETNGNGLTNGKQSLEEAVDTSATGTAKRPHPDDQTEVSSAKKTKTAPADDDVVILDDGAGGLIVIDDD
jgi:ubiquitin-like 1-activating enzyme E1 B